MSSDRLQAGMALLRAGQFHSAERFFRSCLAGHEDAAAWFYLGVAQHGGARLQPAVESFAKAIALAPGWTQAREARAAALVALGRLPEAEEELRAALAAGAASHQISVNLAIVLEQRGKAEEALSRYDGVLASDPDHFAARLNRGALLLAQKRAGEALADFDRLPAERIEVQLNRARALFALHRDAEALRAAEKGLSVEPGNPRASLDRVIALASMGRLEESAAALAQAQARGIAITSLPGGPRGLEQLDPTALYIGRALSRQAVCDWRDRDQLLHAIRSCLADGERIVRVAEPGLAFHALGLPLHAGEIRAIAEATALGVRRQAAGIRIRTPLAAGGGGKRMKIGLISATLRDHPGARLMRRIFIERDRACFEYVVFALNPDLETPIVRDIQAAADALLDVTSWSERDIAERMRAERLDLLLDDGGYLEGCRPTLPASRVAPVQAAYLGIPATLGSGIVDYRIADAYATPPQWQPDWAEKLALMRRAAFIYDTDVEIGDPRTRADHGLPPRGLVWCGFNQAFKIEPLMFDVWMRLLAQVPESVLWLLDDGPVAKLNLRREAAERGISPDRLVFAPRLPLAAHLARHAHADVFVDTLFYNAHTSALDALWSGVPVLTHEGGTMASRLGAGFLRTAGIQDMVVETLTEYERKALEIARNPALLSSLKERVGHAKRNSPLFDATAGVRAFERALKAMVERQRAGLPPDTLVID